MNPFPERKDSFAYFWKFSGTLSALNYSQPEASGRKKKGWRESLQYCRLYWLPERYWEHKKTGIVDE